MATRNWFNYHLESMRLRSVRSLCSIEAWRYLSSCETSRDCNHYMFIGSVLSAGCWSSSNVTSLLLPQSLFTVDSSLCNIKKLFKCLEWCAALKGWNKEVSCDLNETVTESITVWFHPCISRTYHFAINLIVLSFPNYPFASWSEKCYFPHCMASRLVSISE